MQASALPRNVDSVGLGNLLVNEFDNRIDGPVDLHDETLRDGEQTVGVAFDPEQKLEIAKRLLDAGVTYLTAGFPAVSEREREAVRAIVALGKTEGLSCLSRSKKSDIEAVVACGVPTVALFIPISDPHLEHKLRLSEDQAFDRMVDQIQIAKAAGLQVRFAFEDMSRTPLPRIRRFVDGAMKAGADRVVICDTAGVLTPISAYRLTEEVRKIAGGDAIAIHFHDDMGLALANTLAACQAGARMVQGTMLGLGERAGNARTEQLVTTLRYKYDVDTGIHPNRLYELAKFVSEISGFPIALNAPVVGGNVFSHESGIHVAGIQRDAGCYEPYPPELVGRHHNVCFGKHAGLSNLRFAAETLGIEVSDETLEKVLAMVKELKEQPTDEQVAMMLRELSA